MISLILVIKGPHEVIARVNWTERVERHFVGDHGIEISRAADSETVERKEIRTLVGQDQKTKLYTIIDIFMPKFINPTVPGLICVGENVQTRNDTARAKMPMVR